MAYGKRGEGGDFDSSYNTCEIQKDSEKVSLLSP